MKKRILCVLLICLFTLSLSLVFVWVGGCRKDEKATEEVKYKVSLYNRVSFPIKTYHLKEGSLIPKFTYDEDFLEKKKEIGLAFGGWYQEIECINPWAFYTDRVYCDINLYTKWIPIE